MIAAAAAAAAVAASGGATVTMPGQLFSPPRVSILDGETVTWRNDDSNRHVVHSETGLFDSGRLSPGEIFERRFDEPGLYRYYCTIHRTMRGRVEVAGIALSGPDEPVGVGDEVVLEGRAPEGVGEVVIEPLGTVVRTDADGAFAVRVAAERPMSYRARAGALTSPAVAVAVAPEVRLAARRVGRSVSVRIHVTPAQPAARVVLERHEREFFGFVRMRALTLDRNSRARVVLRTGRRLRLRARLAIPVGGYARATSRVVVLPRTGGSHGSQGHH